MKVGYVAGPFRAPNCWLQEKNIRVAEELALNVWQCGAACISPHCNTRYFQGACLDDLWLEGDLEILRRCDFVIMAENWEKSTGAIRERNEAISLGIPVFYSLVTMIRWLELNESIAPTIKCLRLSHL
jgi:hypothetical protein